ncbi:MAG TPA: shikimate dehydrogenase [Actinomycetota bacterium]|nr:shikimate dehydrogenase [Actinomycetota bacterium]
MSASAEPRAIGGATQLLGVIGWPVDHSLSPVIHNAAFAALDIDWVYVPLPVAPGRVRAAVDGLGALGFRGANVTMPHKAEVAGAVDVLDDDAALLGAVNTVVVAPDGTTTGANTDAPGFGRFLADDAGFDVHGRGVLLLGGGGAARACALAVARAGAARITVAVRNDAQVDAVRDVVASLGTAVAGVALADADGVVADVVINATPLGRRGELPPHPRFRPGMLAVDLLYRPVVTPFQRVAREAGADAFGGLGLLVQQAALSFERWTGARGPLEVMSAAAVAAAADPADGTGA